MKYIIATIVFLKVMMLFGQTPSMDPHWQLIWGDDFNFFNSNKWLKVDWAKQGVPLFLANNVYTSGGNLVVKIDDNQTYCPINPPTVWGACSPCDNQWYEYTSGWVESKQPYNTQYGYIEARIKLPYDIGLWSAFWTFVGTGVQNAINAAEIDIFEMLGHLPPNIITTNIHKQYSDGNIYREDISLANFTYANTWHTYGIEWSPSRIVWYVDDYPVRFFPNHGITDSVRIIFDLSVEPEPEYTPSLFPSYMYIDYVRVYELNKDCNLDLNVCNYNFSNHDNKVKKNITIGNGSCNNSLNSGDNIYLRASEGVLINGNFTVPIGAELYIDVDPCY